MTKERFIEGYGVPLYTVGVGGSGGAIQQYVYAQRHPGVIIDAAIPQYSYPDMVTQTDSRRRLRVARALHGRHRRANSEVGRVAEPHLDRGDERERYATESLPRRPAREQRVRERLARADAARAQSALRHGGAGSEFYDPAVLAAVKWTHWDDLRNVYGVDADGYAKVPWDNVGVQYGLEALNDGNIDPAEFLVELDRRELERLKDMVQEGCPFFPCPAVPTRPPGTRGAAGTCD